MTATLVSLTLRGLLNRRRTLLLALIGGVIILIAAVYRISDPAEADSARFVGRLLADFGLGVLMPLVAVIVATAALGSEIEEGTIVYLLARPVSRARIVYAKLLVCWLVLLALVALPVLVSGVIGRGGNPDLALAYAAAAAIGSLEYAAVFVALSLVTSRALVIGLAYVVVWEGVVAGLFAGTRIISVRQHAVAVADALGGEGAVAAELEPAVAFVAAAIVVAVAFVVAVRRLERVELRGETA